MRRNSLSLTPWPPRGRCRTAALRARPRRAPPWRRAPSRPALRRARRRDVLAPRDAPPSVSSKRSAASVTTSANVSPSVARFAAKASNCVWCPQTTLTVTRRRIGKRLQSKRLRVNVGRGRAAGSVRPRARRRSAWPAAPAIPRAFPRRCDCIAACRSGLPPACPFGNRI